MSDGQRLAALNGASQERRRSEGSATTDQPTRLSPVERSEVDRPAIKPTRPNTRGERRQPRPRLDDDEFASLGALVRKGHKRGAVPWRRTSGCRALKGPGHCQVGPALRASFFAAWPAQAVDDRTRGAALVRAHDGAASGPATRLVVVATRPDGPQ
jgi:hypothetical protein